MAKGRHPRNVEFLCLLSELLGYEDDLSGFARLCKKHVANMSSYLNGTKVPGKRVLKGALQAALEWEITPVIELSPIKKHVSDLPPKAGIYALYDSSGSAIYVGQATNLKQEVKQTLQRKMNFPVRLAPALSKKTKRQYKEIATHLSAYEVHSHRLRHNLEALLLRSFPNQSHNNKMGKFI